MLRIYFMFDLSLILSLSHLNSDIRQGYFDLTSMTKRPGDIYESANITFTAKTLIDCGIHTLNYFSDAFAYNLDLQLCRVYDGCFVGMEAPFTYANGWQTSYRQPGSENEIVLGISQSRRISSVGKSVESLDHLKFFVKAYADVHLELLAGGETEFAIKIGGGGDRWDFIKKVTTPGKYRYRFRSAHLSCHEYRLFWVTWSSTEVAYGSGNNVERNMELRLTDFNSTLIIDDVKLETFNHPVRWILKD